MVTNIFQSHPTAAQPIPPYAQGPPVYYSNGVPVQMYDYNRPAMNTLPTVFYRSATNLSNTAVNPVPSAPPASP